LSPACPEYSDLSVGAMRGLGQGAEKPQSPEELAAAF